MFLRHRDCLKKNWLEEAKESKKMNLSDFLKENETPNTRAYEHALDLAFLFVEEMEQQGLGKKELAEKMGISQSRLSNLLNTQPNMTLETIAQFELALNVNMSFELEKPDGCSSEIKTVISDFGFEDLAATTPMVEFSGKISAEFSGMKSVGISGKLEVAAA